MNNSDIYNNKDLQYARIHPEMDAQGMLKYTQRAG